MATEQTTFKKGATRLMLVGEDGNVFRIIGRARWVARRAGWPEEKIDEFTRQAMAGNYDAALRACMEWFDVSAGEGSDDDA